MDEIEGNIFQAGGMNISTAQQNIEEDEDLEEQKRRQKEIESYIKNALDDFNYDDQSTIISSSNSSVELENKYVEAPVGNHLEVLYNIRVKEVETLSYELEQLKLEIVEIKSQQTRKLMLADAETESLRISLKNAQELIVEKSASLEMCSMEKSAQKQEFDNLLSSMKKLEQENFGLRHANENLTEQVAILERGRGANPLSDILRQEVHNTEITKLQASLESAILKAHRLEKENVALCEKQNSIMHDKDALLANKTEIINRLMQNIEESQTRNQELLANNQILQEESDRLRACLKDLENNVQIMKGFTDKTEIIKMLQSELEKWKQTSNKQSLDVEKLQHEYSQLLQTLHGKDELIVQLQLQKVSPSMENNGIQTSFLSETHIEMNHVKGKELDKHQFQLISNVLELLASKDDEIMQLEAKFRILENDCYTLSKKLELSEQKHILTAELQEKAHQLEEILLNNQKRENVDKSVNTSFDAEAIGDNFDIELLQVRFEKELIDRELQMRQELEVEFERRYAKFTSGKSRPGTENCMKCIEMDCRLKENIDVMNQQSIELQQFRETQQKDRMMIMKVLAEWKERFQAIEVQKQALEERLNGVQNNYSSVQQELLLMKTAETQLLATVRTKTENALQQWQRHTLQQVRLQNAQIRKAKENVEIMSRKTDLHIQEIEQNFHKARSELKLSFKNHRTS